MADDTPRPGNLSPEEKAETRTAMTAYKKDHPAANLREVLDHLDLPWKDRLSEGVLRGLVPRRAAGPGGRPRRATGRAAAARPRGRGRTLERVIAQLNDLRQRRDALDSQISDLEDELRDRLNEQLGAMHTGRIFAPPGAGNGSAEPPAA